MVFCVEEKEEEERELEDGRGWRRTSIKNIPGVCVCSSAGWPMVAVAAGIGHGK